MMVSLMCHATLLDRGLLDRGLQGGEGLHRAGPGSMFMAVAVVHIDAAFAAALCPDTALRGGVISAVGIG